MKTTLLSLRYQILFILLFLIVPPVMSQPSTENPELDKKVKAFLSDKRYTWRDMNVPASDGQLLYDIIVENGYRNAVEIGTSTGHSGVWIAWALSKTGGKLITMEIDERRYKEALANFEKAGVSEYVDARLCDAHEMAKQLEGPIDFVFSDADKVWYTNYFKDLAPKMSVGGCFTAHNITQRRRQYGITEFMEYIESQSNFKTTYNNDGGGVSISYKTAEK
ncbi:class I SAM-dependent methyltransferase [Draconibacterium sp. IB214405]|uniref:O-methyltransferase n=1 Tax=Draconibacterium sp. IB214405 TaxID=3097352 RepID=UPI002A106209|nr:class I SAM-dependent methyltransferase [Draconibacterium sp. IB214405]MDX8338801.1 class I SAM-dependent methyltransferase [Draconibacterium sp. IB214405]